MSDAECRCGHGKEWHRRMSRCAVCDCDDYEPEEAADD